MESELRRHCKTLKLGNLEEFVEEVEFENRRQYLTEIMEKVIRQRRANRAQRLIRRAGFPTAKTIVGYDFSPITFPDGITRSKMLDLSFLQNNENVLMMGAVGTGKTHLAVALGHKACAQGHRVAFHRAADLTQKLIQKHREGQVEKLMAKIARAEMFVLDEVGYVPFDRKGSQLLFQVISRSYETQSVIITTNLEFGRWNEMFGDAKLTAALVDRLIHHAHILSFEGESFRFKQAMKTTKKEGDN